MLITFDTSKNANSTPEVLQHLSLEPLIYNNNHKLKKAVNAF